MIAIIGLGNGAKGWSVAAAEYLASSDCILVKTALSDTYQSFSETGLAHRTLDEVYERSRNFDSLNKNLVKEVLACAKQFSRVAYLVDGSGYDDGSAALLLQQKAEITVFPAAGKASRAMPTAPSLTVYAAQDFADNTPLTVGELPLVIYELDSALLAGEIKLKLEDLVGAERDAVLYTGGKAKPCKVYEIDRMPCYGYDTTLYLPSASLLGKERFDMYDVVRILRVLRSDNGCPWDKVQTHESICANLVEESYELIDAINSGDIENMREETGDVLLQALFHAQIAEDTDEYSLTDAVSELCTKLITRHSHIFGEDVAKDADDALSTWEKNKQTEKHQQTYSQTLEAVPESFPALLLCYKLQKRAAKAKMDFADVADTLAALESELKELMEANTEAERENEGGDLLFAAVNLLRHLGVDPETALHKSAKKFIARFKEVERLALAGGRPMTEYTPEELDVFWKEAKKKSL